MAREPRQLLAPYDKKGAPKGAPFFCGRPRLEGWRLVLPWRARTTTTRSRPGVELVARDRAVTIRVPSAENGIRVRWTAAPTSTGTARATFATLTAAARRRAVGAARTEATGWWAIARTSRTGSAAARLLIAAVARWAVWGPPASPTKTLKLCSKLVATEHTVTVGIERVEGRWPRRLREQRQRARA